MLNIVLLCVCFVVCFSFNCFVVGLSVFKLLFSVVIVVCCVVCCCFVWGVELAGSWSPTKKLLLLLLTTAATTTIATSTNPF
jgi:hypothetical protein